MILTLVDVPRFPESGWPFLGAVAERVDGVLVRDKSSAPRQLYDLGRRIQTAIGNRPLWIAENLAVALALNAQGFHVSSQHIPAHVMRQWWPRLLSASVHDEHERSYHQGADFFIWGHTFSTSSKPGASPRPRDELASIVRGPTPVLAIGGINSRTVVDLAGWGFSGVVVSDGIWVTDNPGIAAENLGRQLATLNFKEG